MYAHYISIKLRYITNDFLPVFKIILLKLLPFEILGCYLLISLILISCRISFFFMEIKRFRILQIQKVWNFFVALFILLIIRNSNDHYTRDEICLQYFYFDIFVRASRMNDLDCLQGGDLFSKIMRKFCKTQ